MVLHSYSNTRDDVKQIKLCKEMEVLMSEVWEMFVEESNNNKDTVPVH